MKNCKIGKWNRANQKGIALIATLGLASVIAILAAGLMAGGLAELQAAKRFEDRTVAFHLAEGALDQRIAGLKTNRSDTAPRSGAPNNYQITGSYGTTVDPSENNPNVFEIQATGTVNSMGGTTDRRITAVVELGSTSPFTYGIFAQSFITMSGNAVTDSYNSNNGPYTSDSAGTNGDIGSNRAGENTVTLSGNVRIKGDVMVGPDANIDTAITTSGNSVIEGERSAASAPMTLDPVTLPSGVTNLGNLSISGNRTVTLPTGTYVYSSISISGNGRLNLSGATKIYVTGDVSVSGNGISTAQNLPPNLEIHVQGTHTLSLSGNGNFYGAVYAPDSRINISGNGQLFGAVIGETIVDSGNGNIHFDEALNSSSTSNSSTQLRSWSEL
ncbi:MAG: hypothetical protein HY583_02675 [Candidatus Omnitrophica bacterium]|nr:hypothetical protein [Candidatus Omnitrophota bacterium]